MSANVMELKIAVEDLYTYKEDLKENQEAEKKLRGKIAELEDKIFTLLDAAGLDKFVSDNAQVSYRIEEYPSAPQTKEEKKALFDYLNKEGIFWNTATVNAMTLRKLWKEAKEQGETVPGLSNVFSKVKMSCTARKK